LSVLDDLLERGTAQLRRGGIESARLEARLLLAAVLGVTQEELIAGQGVPNPQAMMGYETVLRRRLAREPLAYILGVKEFWSLPFAVGPGVLIPRPETELLVEEALRCFPDRDAELEVLDLGTGSGCLLLSFLSERPGAQGIGVDSSNDALAYAAHNAEKLGLSFRTAFRHGRWAEDLRDRFDIVFINPPYIVHEDIAKLQPEVAYYEPGGALSGGADGLAAYRQIAGSLPQAMRPGGRAFIEIGQGQADAVGEIFAGVGLTLVRAAPDLAGIPRCIVLEPRLR
jgi:release factor glutamine methyltransferase